MRLHKTDLSSLKLTVWRQIYWRANPSKYDLMLALDNHHIRIVNHIYDNFLTLIHEDNIEKIYGYTKI